MLVAALTPRAKRFYVNDFPQQMSTPLTYAQLQCLHAERASAAFGANEHATGIEFVRPQQHIIYLNGTDNKL
jgi:hypothetical protein